MTVRPALELPLACAAAAAVGAAAACTCRPSHTAASASATPTTPLHRQPEPEPSNDDEPARRPDAAFNCSPAPRIASAPLMWVAERPGRDAADSPTEADVDHWVEHMQRRGVERVLCLLGDKHLKLYSHLEVDGTLQQAVERRGLRWAGVPFSRDKPLYLHLIAAARQLRDAERCGESVVVHCSAGCGRSAAVVVAWLCGRGGEDFSTAVARVVAEAELESVRRQPLEVGEQDLQEACEELRLQWGALGLAAGSPAGAGAEGAASARETELAMQLRQADEAVLQISKELREAKRAAAGTPDSDGSDGGGDSPATSIAEQQSELSFDC